MSQDEDGWTTHDSSKKGRDRKKDTKNIKIEIGDSVINRTNIGNILEESKDDEAIELDSKEYEEWRRGTDDDSYMSDSKYFGGTTQYSSPASSSGNSGDNSSSNRNIIIVAVVAVLLLVGSGLLGIYLYSQNAEDVASWPTAEGMVLETYY